MRYKLLRTDASPPTRKHDTDAGLDVYAYGDYIIKPHSYKIVRTGIAVETPPDCMTLIKAKSRSDYLIGGGVVDHGYTGEILVKVINPIADRFDVIIRHGDPVAQLIVLPIWIEEIEEVDEFDLIDLGRGDTGGIVEQV